MIEKPQKPKSQNADLANLPLALAPLCQQPHWVLWRWERRREKWTKPPYMPTGANAKSDDPSTWSDYVTALGAMQRANGSVDGIGFMLRGTDLTSVDLDHCLDQYGTAERLGGDVARDGERRLRRAHAIGRRVTHHRHRRRRTAAAPVDDQGRARPDAAIEIYRNCERYITITGAQIGDCTELQPIDVEQDRGALRRGEGGGEGRLEGQERVEGQERIEEQDRRLRLQRGRQPRSTTTR